MYKRQTLYYSKNAAELKDDFIDKVLGCSIPLPADCQKEAFQALVEEVLGDNCSVEAIKNIHEELTEIVQEHKDDPDPVVLDKNTVETIFAKSGLDDDSMEAFDQCYDDTVGSDTELLLDNIYSSRSFEVKTQVVTVKVNPDRTDLVETKLIDGRRCLVIDLQGTAEVNGVAVKPM